METKYSDGKDEFEDYVFDRNEWSAPTMVSPDEIKERIKSFKLEGREIQDMWFVGMCYNLTTDMVEEISYNWFEQNGVSDEEELQRKSNYKTIKPYVEFEQTAMIDEPFLIRFRNEESYEFEEDVFAICCDQEPEYRMSMNCIPWGIDPGVNALNVDANVLFGTCLGRTIKEVEVKTIITDRDPFTDEVFESGITQEIVTGIILRLDDGSGLLIKPQWDYCVVSHVGVDGEPLPIKYGDLKPGLYNYEDIRIDDISGYESESYRVMFGMKGKWYAGVPYFRIMPEDKRSVLVFSYKHVDLFEFAISKSTGKIFDENEFYDFRKSEWEDILGKATEILDHNSFDALLDYLTSIKLDRPKSEQMIAKWAKNSAGHLWVQKNEYKTQLEDIKKWTALYTRPDSDEKSCFIKFYGF